MDGRKSFFSHLASLDMYVSCLSLAVLITATVSGVFMRYLINRPFYWLEELQLWCFVWTVFLAASYLARQNGHIAIDAIISLFPPLFRRVVSVATSLVGVVVMGFLCYYSCLHVRQMYERSRLTNILEIPYSLIYGVVPVTCLLMGLSLLYFMVRGRGNASGEGAFGAGKPAADS